jgi:hypothetical protein
MSYVYELIGRGVVRFGVAYVRRRYGRQLRFALAFGVVAVIAGAYLASREVQEG